MSVTFHPAIVEDDYRGSRIYCAESEYGDKELGHVSRDFESYEEAVAAYTAGLEIGEFARHCCGIRTIWAIDTDDVSVNLSNTNARDLLERLGYADDDGTVELCGSADPEDLLGRILVARALASDVGIPSAESTGSGGARLLEVGRPEGYFAEKFTRLEALATTCRVLGRKIAWN